MGIQDRDYMRRDRRPPTLVESTRGHLSNWRGILAATAAVIAVASAGLWLYRDARNIVGDFGPAEGTLRLNINTATQEELESVPGIGPAKAAAIIADRPYATVDDLVRLDGIGPSQVESFRPFLKTEGETEKL
jgi:competence ComEA-like helix-hairpin-helix protein